MSVSAVAPEALAALALQRTLWSQVRLHRHFRPQSSVSDRTLDTSGPRATDKMKWGWEGGAWRGRDRDGQIAAA